MAKSENAQVQVEQDKAPAQAKTMPAFKVKKNLTLPVLKLVKDVPAYLKILTPIEIGKKVEEGKDPAIICEAMDLETSEVFHFLVPAVVQGVLHDEYGAPRFGKLEAKGDVIQIDAGDGQNRYVGLGFMVTDKGKPEGKNYKGMTVCEIELE